MLIACQKAGIPEPFITYLDNLYKSGDTQLQVNGHLSTPIRCNQGVKQGDPLSPTLFSYVVDWCLGAINQDIGFKWAKEILSYLAFTDDLVLLAESQEDLQAQLNRVVGAMKKCGLEVNPAKCASLALDVVRLISFTDEKNFLRVNNEEITALKLDEAYKYLGLHVSAKGAEPKVLSKLTSLLGNLTKAPFMK